MTTRYFTLLLLSILYTGAAFAQTRKAALHIGLVYPVSSNGTLANEYTNRFSFHAIGGVSRSERAFTLSGFANAVKDSAAGVQIAGFANFIGGSAHDVQLAGFMNYTKGDVRGTQVAGFTNFSRSTKGLQLAGFMNAAVNRADVQLAGFMNLTQEARVQTAGFINIAREVHGAQIAGFMNMARKVKGVQVGFINIADSSDYPVGVINIVKNGEKAIGVTVDETLTTLATFRSGGKRLYGIIGTGINLREDNTLYALETGIGWHIPVSRIFRINAEGVLLTLTDFEKGSYMKSSLRVLPAVRLGRFELFAGPSFNCVNISRNTGKSLISDYTWEHKSRRGDFTGLYFGGVGGIQFML